MAFVCHSRTNPHPISRIFIYVLSNDVRDIRNFVYDNIEPKKNAGFFSQLIVKFLKENPAL